MPRLDIRCSDLELDRWRGAAGRETLASWVRRTLDAAAGPGIPHVPESPIPGKPDSRGTATTGRPHMKLHRPAVECPGRTFVDGVCRDCGAPG